MNRIFKLRSYRLALFWQFFASYFILILIPVMVAGVFTYFFVVKLIENVAETSNHILIRNYAEKTDASFSSLQNQMINLLNSTDKRSLNKLSTYAPDELAYYEEVHALIDQLNSLNSKESISGAFLYFANQDLVIGASTHSSKESFFTQYYQVSPPERAEYEANFRGKKMMSFSQPYTVYEKQLNASPNFKSSSNLSVIMSYPFNTVEPEVYLVVNLDRNKLGEQIHMNENWITGTAIIDQTGAKIARSGKTDMGTEALLDATRDQSVGMITLEGRTIALSFLKLRFNDSWFFVSYVDLDALLKPSLLIRTLSIWFLAFFLIVGAVVSYSLSRRLYKPILEIKAGLSSQRASQASVPYEGNEFDLIKRFSHTLVSENKELAALISGMAPIVKEDFITKILLGEYRDGLSIEYYAKEIDFAYHAKAARTVLCIEIQYYAAICDQMSETTRSFTMGELTERIAKAAPGEVWLCQTRPDLLVCVVQHDAVLHFGPQVAAEIIELILQPFDEYFKATIGIGKTVHEIGDLHMSYKSALAMLRYKSLHPMVETFSENNAWDDRNLLDSFLSVDEVNRIFNQYRSGEYDKLLNLVIELLDKGMRKNASAYQVKNICVDVLNTWIRALETDRNDFNIPYYSELFDKLNRCVTWDEIKQCFQDIHVLLFRNGSSRDPSRQMAEILAYIHLHYGEDHSIERLAQRINISVSHFSRTFKEEVGEKYVEYMAKYRLTKAKQLLLETDMNIDDIAEKVGYVGRNSFIRIFRKYEGITPGKYRLIHLET
jgi:two-component system response regulator YesN